MATTTRRQRGTIDQLLSGAYRVRVYAGRDPLTGKRHDLDEVVPVGPRAAAEAEKVRRRLVNQVDEQRNPRTRASVNQLMDRYLEVLDVETSTRKADVGYIDRHVRPLLGHLQAGKVGAEVLDSFYAELHRCRAHCDRRPRIDHRKDGEHECTSTCREHVCKPLSASTIRQIHWILSGAYNRAVRWRWVAVSPVQFAEPPAPPRPDPQPPTPADAARILSDAWTDPGWGMCIWLAMTAGARRGELCALRRRHVEFDDAGAILVLRGSATGSRNTLTVKDTKTHQQRRVALDETTVDLLRRHLAEQDDVATRLGVTLGPEAFLFSQDPDCSASLVPDTVTQQYERMVARLGIETNLHKMRHYHATELLAAGVDLRTVAGRLGHAGGGTTTLRVYAAWVSQADRQAAAAATRRLPTSGLPTRSEPTR